MIADRVIANMKVTLREIDELAAYATAYRYPTPAGRIPDAPPGGELAMLIAKVEAVLNEAASRFGVELAKTGAPAATPKPIR